MTFNSRSYRGFGAVAINNANQFERLGLENQQLRPRSICSMVMSANSPLLRDVYQLMSAWPPATPPCSFTVKAVRKELAARAIHNNSPRKDQPFVALNCAALTESLLESELFGHERGPSPAPSPRKRPPRSRRGRQHFLDEIGELPFPFRPKLTSCSPAREFVRSAGRAPFTSMLVSLPPPTRISKKSRPRGQISPRSLPSPQCDFRWPCLLFANTLKIFSPRRAFRRALTRKKCNRRIRGISPEAAPAFCNTIGREYRELENAMERAVVIGNSEFILPEDLPRLSW